MKKIILFALMILLLAANCRSAEKFLAELNGSYMVANDSAFKEVYGKGGFFPEIRLQYGLGSALYIWGGAGIFSKKGLTPQLQNDAKSRQIYLSLGGGYIARLSEKINLRVGPGLFVVAYREESAGNVQSGSRFGLRADADLLYALGAKFLAGVTIGYASASGSIEDISFKMGGFKIGAAVAICF